MRAALPQSRRNPRSGLGSVPAAELDGLFGRLICQVSIRVVANPYVSNRSVDPGNCDYSLPAHNLRDEGGNGLGLRQAAEGREDIAVRVPGEALETDASIASNIANDEAKQAIWTFVTLTNFHLGWRWLRPEKRSGAGQKAWKLLSMIGTGIGGDEHPDGSWPSHLSGT
jgi:hypothetical protein